MSKVNTWFLALSILLMSSSGSMADDKKTETASKTATPEASHSPKSVKVTFIQGKENTFKVKAAGNAVITLDQTPPTPNLASLGLTFDEKTDQLTGSPKSTGTYTIKFVATDGQNKTPLTVALTVKAAANAASGPCVPSTFTVRLRTLEGADADGLAAALNSAFADFFIVTAAEKSATTKPSSDPTDPTPKPATPPNKYLCVYTPEIDQKSGKPTSVPAPRSGGTLPANLAELKIAIGRLDQSDFASVGLNQDFLVPMHSVDGGRLTALANGLPSPAPGFSLSDADTLVRSSGRMLVLHPAGANLLETLKPGTSLAPQAAKLKHDLLALDAQAVKLATEGTGRQCIENWIEGISIGNCHGLVDPIKGLEHWDAQHTVRFAVLDPRAVALALPDLFPFRDIEVLEKQHAIVLRPNSIRLVAPGGVIATSDAIIRDSIYDEAKAEQDWEKQIATEAASAAKSPSGNANSNGAPTTTTKSSTTITTPVNGTAEASANGNSQSGKAPAPIKVETTTSTQTTSTGSSGSGSNSAGATQAKNPGASDPAANAAMPNAIADSAATLSANGMAATPPDKPAASAQTPMQSPAPRLPTGTVVRLFHLRQASNIATVMNAMVADKNSPPLVEALSDFNNDDLLLILPPVPGQQDRTASIRRMIATLDEPRPAVSLQVWSYEVSYDKDTKSEDHQRSTEHARQVASVYGKFKDRIQKADGDIQRALSVGLYKAIEQTRGPGGPAFFDDDFKTYLTLKSEACLKDDQYCLGYETALDFGPGDLPTNPNTAAAISFNRYIVLIAAAADSQAHALVDTTVNAMEALNAPPIQFGNLRSALYLVTEPSNLHLFRAALLDFLFQYKWSQAYPNDFDPYYLQRSAQILDGYLNNLVSALNKDLDCYIEGRLDHPNDPPTKDFRHVGLANFGEVQVGVISGDAAAVSGAVNNYFDITQPALLKDILGGLLGGAGSAGGGSSSASTANTAAAPAATATSAGGSSTGAANTLASAAKLLTPWQAVALNALVTASAPPQLVAQVNAQTTLAVTPVSLDTASAAELNLTLQVSNPTSTLDASKGATSAFIRRDLANAVANFNVQTRVRVDSFKLFQVSSLSMDITHPQSSVPVPVVGWIYEGIFGTVPWMRDHILAIPRQPLTVQNRSIAVVRAVIVPTAMDLGLSMPFRDDHLDIPVGSNARLLASPSQIANNFKEFHKLLITCILRAEPAQQPCMTHTRLSDVPEQIDDEPRH